jgi:4-hydroxy-tetrahydrodipicolinate reductase
VIKVGVLGAKGRMGSLVCQVVRDASDLELVAEVDIGDLREPLADCQVVVDFTSPAAVLDNLNWCVTMGLNVVIGTSGFDDAKLAEAREMLRVLLAASARAHHLESRVLVVPNFSIGAVLMMRFAEQRGSPSPRDHRAAPRGQGGRAVRHRGQTAAMIAAARSRRASGRARTQPQPLAREAPC